jgi:D-alanyl-D-alanine carboxypeptidase
MPRHHVCLAALLAFSSMSVGPVGADPGEPSSLEATLLPVVTAQMTQMGIPGLIVSVQTPDRGTWQAALGVSDIATRAPMDVGDHMRIGSITKSMTATVILQLAQEGRLRLDDQLAPYFPGVQTNQATIRQALQLSSGIADYTTDAFLNALADAPQRVWSPAELVGLVADEPAMFPAGTGWYYSNTNYVMLGIVAEQVTGQPLGRLIADRIFTPLNLTGCSFPGAADAAIPAPRSRGYMLSTTWDRPPTPPAPLPEMVDVTDFNPSWAAGSGQAICTAADLAVWGRALATGELLEPAMQAQRMTLIPAGDPNARYGLGIVNINGLVGHNGEISGYMTQTARRESDGTVIVVLSNLMIAPDLTEPATAISEMISRAIPPTR